MHKQRLILLALTAAVGAACSPTDRNYITGTTAFTGVALASDPSAYSLHVRLVPRRLLDTVAVDSTVADTVPAHEVPADSGVFNPIATLLPQGTVIANANGSDAEQFTFSNDAVASLNGAGYVVPDTTGTTTLTITYTDKNHSNAQTTLDIPITVTQVP